MKLETKITQSPLKVMYHFDFPPFFHLYLLERAAQSPTVLP